MGILREHIHRLPLYFAIWIMAILFFWAIKQPSDFDHCKPLARGLPHTCHQEGR